MSGPENVSSRFKGQVYLDHAGAGQYSEEQMQAIFKDMTSNAYGNPHTRNAVSSYTSDVIYQARSRIVDHFNTTLEHYHVIFTSSATAAAKLVAESFDFNQNAIDDRGTFAFLVDNHTSIVGMREIACDRGANIEPILLESAKEIFGRHQNGLRHSTAHANNLFVYPAESNFSGDKYSLEWISEVHSSCLQKLTSSGSGKWYCMLDAACFVATNALDLSKYKPDFVCLSFYKMFGYPTGLGALLVHHEAAGSLKKSYFGGGTVSMSITPIRHHVLKESLHERFEDGTLPFLSIVALRQGFEALRTAGEMDSISKRTFELARYTFRKLLAFRHSNGAVVAEIYSQSNFEDISLQGNIITFNLRRPNGDYVGFTEVEEIASLNGILLRTGCFCNTGACQAYLKLSNEDLINNFKAGHVCGDNISLINGRPTGAVRISFGHSSSQDDADRLLKMVEKSFVISQGKKIFHLELTPKSDCKDIYVSRMFVYPVKSCGGQEVKTWPLSTQGFLYDRQWMVIDYNSVPLNLKREPRLCGIKVTIDVKEDLLSFSYPYYSSISIPLTMDQSSIMESTKLCNLKICGKRVQGYDCGDKIASWLDNCLDRDGCKLIRQHMAMHEKDMNPKQQTESFVNDSPFTLVSQESLTWLKTKLMENESCDDLLEDDLLVRRFRTNIVIDGNLYPFQEETWSRFRINSHFYKILRSCTRCQAIGVNEKYLDKEQEPLRTLASERGQLMPFGMNFKRIEDRLQLLNNSVVSIGDRLSIIEESTHH